jgi:putative heme-binding domain-containing protein
MPNARKRSLRWAVLVAPCILAAQTDSDPIATQTAEDVARGKRLFESQCAVCHGITGTGGRGANLAQPRLRRARDNLALFAVIQNGVDGTEMPEAWQMTDREIWQVAGYVRTLGRTAAGAQDKGDAARGKSIYAARGCAACHIVGGQGGSLGPELTEIGARRSAPYLRQAILDPSAAVPEGFLVVSLTTQTGAHIRGMRVNEDSFTMQIKDAANRFTSFRKSDLVKIEKEFGKSLMPSYRDKLTPAEIDDLIAYLSGLRGEP